MHVHTIETTLRPEFIDPVAAGLLSRARDKGLPVDEIRRANVFRIKADLDDDTLDRIASTLLADPITETYSIDSDIFDGSPGNVVEVAFNPGVIGADAKRKRPESAERAWNRRYRRFQNRPESAFYRRDRSRPARNIRRS